MGNVSIVCPNVAVLILSRTPGTGLLPSASPSLRTPCSHPDSSNSQFDEIAQQMGGLILRDSTLLPLSHVRQKLYDLPMVGPRTVNDRLLLQLNQLTVVIR
jgi:hypothetical protein